MSTAQLSHFAETIFNRTYRQTPNENWEGCANRVANWVAPTEDGLRDTFEYLIAHRKFMPAGRYLYSAGREIPQNTNCFLLRCEDSREGWAELSRLHIVALGTGGGVGTEYSNVRARGVPNKRFGGAASGPVSVMKMMNDIVRHIHDGGARRGALWAGLNWQHPDIREFIHAKEWDEFTLAGKAADFNYPAPLDQTNISVGLDDEFFERLNANESKTTAFFQELVGLAMRTGEPGFSVNLGDKSNETLRNPCTEVTSDEHGDCCNLGSINMSRVSTLDEFEQVIRAGVQLLYRGTMHGWLPDDVYRDVRYKRRRIGLGLLGLHEWCLQRGLDYAPSAELAAWMQMYQEVSDDEALKVADQHGDVAPIAVRAIAPAGTISIIAETTSGMEPVYCAAYKRRFQDQGVWKHQFVIDPTVKRMVAQGVKPEDIQDAMSLGFEDRLRMQAFLQNYVDQGISSTVNLPAFGTPGNQNVAATAATLKKYLPGMRGITLYPDGARAGQPITPVDYAEAAASEGVTFEEEENRCAAGVCGI